jgi:phosphonate transport system substrate-binding protein
MEPAARQDAFSRVCLGSTWLLMCLLLAMAVLSSVQAAEPDNQASQAKQAEPTARYAEAAPFRLRIGTISTRPDFHSVKFARLAEYVRSELAGDGLQGVDIRLYKDVDSAIAALRSGQLDWLTATVANALQAERADVARMELVAERQQGHFYRSLFFVERNQWLNSLADLRGKCVAFRSTSSTSSFFVPASLLLETGIPLKQMQSIRTPLDPDAINFVFSNNETNSALWVAKGLCEVGLANSIDWQDPRLFPHLLKSELNVFHTSEAVPLGVEMFRVGLPKYQHQLLRQTLLYAGVDPSARRALQDFADAFRFSELSPDMLKRIRSYSARFESVRALLDAPPGQAVVSAGPTSSIPLTPRALR